MSRMKFAGLLLALAGPAVAQSPVDLTVLDKDMAGAPAQVLVLGSTHLSELTHELKPEALDAVLDRLASFKPDFITVESISGEACDMTARHPAVYRPDDMKTYCRDTSAAKAATGWDVPAAIAEARRMLKEWPANPTPQQRRHLAAAFLVANEDESALVQWLYLPAAERRPGDGLNETLVAQLNWFASAKNEGFQIGARLAARLGLQRVYAVDDHTGDNVDVPDVAAYGKAIQQAWNSARPQLSPVLKREDELSKASDLLPLYRYMNSPDVLRVVADSDFGAAMRDTSPQHGAQIYVAGWETRNLRMVANIRATFRERPGARVLAIVGRTHKPWFDSLLGQMQGVEIVDAERVLK